jgi:hypothetical protein
MPEENSPQPGNEDELPVPADVPNGHNPPSTVNEELLPEPAAAEPPILNVVVEGNGAPTEPAPEKKEPRTAFDSEQWEALTELLEAKKELAVAKRPLFDRVVMTGLIPFALLVAGPWATWYFSQRAEEGLEQVKKANKENVRLAELIEDLTAMDKAREAELLKMEKMVTRLDDTMKNALIQMTVMRLISEHARPRAEPVGAMPLMPMLTQPDPPEQPSPVYDPPDLPDDPDEEEPVAEEDILPRAMEQLQMPGLNGPDLERRVKNAIQRVNAPKR